MVIFDTNFVLFLLNPDIAAPNNPETNQTLSRAKDRIDFLVQNLAENRNIIGIPTPVFSEALVGSGNKLKQHIDLLTGSSRYRILPFNSIAAIELAVMTHSAIVSGDKRCGSTDPWQKVKIDRQIVAIGVVERASTIYTDDHGVIALAREAGLEVVSSWELPLPPENPQGDLFA